MKQRYILLILLLAGLTIGALANEEEPETKTETETEAEHLPHWEYEGPSGPTNWGTLHHTYSSCGTGHAQSPIDLEPAEIESNTLDLTNIAFNYGDAYLKVVNNGHTVQADVGGQTASTIRYSGITYKLAQFHIHHPSEHTINGQPVPMEIHFVHQQIVNNEVVSLAVVGILVLEGEDKNTSYAPVLNVMPAKAKPKAGNSASLDLSTLLPENPFTYMTYNGSLTTPPCTEIVRWLVLTEPVFFTRDQINQFSRLYSMNARPVQNLNDRDLLYDNAN